MSKYEIYCDESRQDLLDNKMSINSMNRYTIIGALWIKSELRESLKNRIKELRYQYNTFGEIKWNKVSDSKLNFYKELINLFFSYNSDIRFRCIVIDASKFEADKFHDSDSELGFYKFYYQLIYYWLKENNDYYIYTDYKKNKEHDRLVLLKNILNTAKYGNYVKHIQAINSSESLILQLEDIIMGAVGYKFNLGKNGKSNSKKSIVKLIEKNNGFSIGSKNNSKFNVFKIKLKEYQ